MTKPSTVTISGKPFSCVPMADADFKDFAVVYVILCVADGGKWTVLDVGESGEVGSRIDSHDRRSCWERNCCSGKIWVCVYPMPSSQYTRQDRERLERCIREEHGPPCGKE